MNVQKRPDPVPQAAPATESLREKLHGWRLGLNPDGEQIAKALICAALLVFFSLLQTTLFTRFRPLGAVPDLILPLVIAVAMTAREKWGAVFGVIAAFVIESLGGSTLTLLPLCYMPAGYLAGLLSVYYFRDSLAVRAIYTFASCAFRAVFTAVTLLATVGDITLISAFRDAIFPEFFASLLFAVLPHAAAKLCLRRFEHGKEE